MSGGEDGRGETENVRKYGRRELCLLPFFDDFTISGCGRTYSVGRTDRVQFPIVESESFSRSAELTY